jgi:hypothetical protein
LDAPLLLNVPEVHGRQPSPELPPVALNVPAAHSPQPQCESTSRMYCPGPQKSHLDAPAFVKPVAHDEQESTCGVHR